MHESESIRTIKNLVKTLDEQSMVFLEIIGDTLLEVDQVLKQVEPPLPVGAIQLDLLPPDVVPVRSKPKRKRRTLPKLSDADRTNVINMVAAIEAAEPTGRVPRGGYKRVADFYGVSSSHIQNICKQAREEGKL